MAHPVHRLEFSSPATEWVEALPVGNGRLAAMVYGGVEDELLWLNDGSVWSGPPRRPQPHPVTSEVAAAAIAASREAVAAGDYVAAEQALHALQHSYPQSFQPLARLRRTIGRVHEPSPQAEVVPANDTVTAPSGRHARGLDLQAATAWTRAEAPAGTVTQRVFVSAPHQVMVVQVESSGQPVAFTLDSPLRLEQSGAEDGEAWMVLRAPDDVVPGFQREPDPIRWAQDPRGVQAAVVMRALGGEVRARTAPHGVVIEVDGGATLVMAVRTTFTRLGQDPSGDPGPALAAARQLVEQAAAAGLEQVEREHVAAHRALYDRAELRLGNRPEPAVDAPADTDALLEAVAQGETARVGAAPELAALLFQYGRYLLISSSRPGGTPANLQGIWNQQMQPPWSSDFTMNINLEMNYWLAETTGLVECLEPLFALIEAFAERGTEPAERVYGSQGWVAHHASDIWAFVDPMGDGTHDPAWAFWPFAGVWLSSHMVDRLTFSHDEEAARRFWPTLAGAARFVLDWLEPRPDGTLGTSPSTSPENRFAVAGTARGSSVAADSTMDLELSRGLLRSLLRLAETYGIADEALLQEAAEALPRIRQIGVDSAGLLREWADVEEMVDPRHRHLVHLVGVHPTDASPSAYIADAARRSLDARGDEGTGWSLAWKMAMRARLRDPEGVQRLLDLFVRRSVEIEPGPTGGRWRGGLYRNLFSAHPPFQIDGNLGVVAAISEALLASHAGVLELLPALPPDLPDGEVRGLRARGGLVVDMRWRGGALTGARISSDHPVPRTVRVVHGSHERVLDIAPGQSVRVAHDLSLEQS
ncbi:glycosyl hydrolase family 95 catalytic domain-containing protein [Pseudactinotalea suaedae]|uniref:glycosyl hydrolase family 95 catalytic domain-containing protein n=1 Tax=Pseudactinotalea suaedae TaxID=1524924 RepID=UPI0013912645|nr:glycoside hydrolase N-terminal domain-containing protein [Pseudactinotalea suaedae]